MQRRVVHYQTRDANVSDYQIYFRSDCHIGFRGPRVPDHLGVPYGVALGSAAVFGRFVHQPFSQQLGLAGYPTLNLGISGARPQTFAAVRGLKALLERAEFVVLEFMSSRGYEVDFFKPDSALGNIGRYNGPTSTGEPDDVAKKLFVDQAWTQALKDFPASVVEGCIAASRRLYVEGMKWLIDLVAGDLVLLWLSQRTPNYQPEYRSMAAASGGFPHFIDDSVVEEVIGYARQSRQRPPALVEIVSRQGLPMTLFNRFNGQPEPVLSPGPNSAVNTYYPSQDMHDEAAVKLLSVLSSRPRAA